MGAAFLFALLCRRLQRVWRRQGVDGRLTDAVRVEGDAAEAEGVNRERVVVVRRAAAQHDDASACARRRSSVTSPRLLQTNLPAYVAPSVGAPRTSRADAAVNAVRERGDFGVPSGLPAIQSV